MPESEGASEGTTGPPPQTGPSSEEGRAETAPLKRDNTRIDQSAVGEGSAAAAEAGGSPTSEPGATASAGSSGQDTTRPTFPPPAGASGTRAFPAPPPSNYADPGPYRYQPAGQQPAGQQPAPVGNPALGNHAPDNRVPDNWSAQGAPAGPAAGSWSGQDRDPSSAAGPDRGARKITPLGWTMRGLGLVAVAVVSGLLWLAVKPDSAPPPGGTEQPTKYDFALRQQVEGLQGCADVSNGKIKQYLKQHPCQHLTRALYTTKLPDGQQVLSSVTTVLMPNANSAEQLNALTTKDKTGNISDLVDDGSIGTERYPKLGDAGYVSAVQGNLVAIGDSAYFGKSSKDGDPQLREVTSDALKKGWPQDKAPAR